MDPQTKKITQRIREEYGAEPEFLWPERYPDYYILRHSNNRKWFALVGRVAWTSLGSDSKELVEIINLKFDKGAAREFAENTPGIFPAYHMNKDNWITVALDDKLPDEVILELVNRSYMLTDK